MNTPALLWIILAIVVVLVVVGIIVAVGNKRRKDKTVSFERDTESPKELTREEKSGNYQAAGGFNFAQATPGEADKERVVRADQKLPPITPGMPVESAPATHKPEPVAKPAPERTIAEQNISEQQDTEVERFAPVEENPQNEVASEEPEQDLTEVRAEKTVEEAPQEATSVEETVEVPSEESPAEPDQSAEPIEGTHAADEAREAAVATAATEDAVSDAVEQTPVPQEDAKPASQPIDDIDPATGRLGRLRGRLSKSQNAVGQGLLGILTAGDLDEDAWEEIEDTLIMADLGAQLTQKVTDSLRTKIAERGVSSEAEARAMLRETLIEAGRPELDRSIKAMPVDGKPAVVLVVGVNGTGKTTTTGKLARVLVAMGHKVLLGAADTFRAAAADQLETWGRRVGAATVRGKEGADPASVAFDAVAQGVQDQADVVLIDTAGRLHTSHGLMDQLGKVKRVVEKKSHVDEVLLVIDATVGQNGLMQARVFREVVDITGVVLTKLDGTAKGGIVFQVQEELGVPVKLVGLGEGADHLAPFEVESFVDALLGK